MSKEFIKWPKIPRLENETLCITEKLDGTSGCILITPEGEILAGSRNRWLDYETDNHGFYQWVRERRDAIREVLPPGRHYGEFIGKGIGRNYDLTENYFMLFNVSLLDSLLETKVEEELRTLALSNIGFVPCLRSGIKVEDLSLHLSGILDELREDGSYVNQFPRAEGVCIYSLLTKKYYKVLIDK